MKTIDVKDQFRLSIARTFNITVSGIRYRLFRSSVTVVVIAVAIAFLMNVLSEGLLKGAVGKMARRTIRDERQAPRWAARLSVPGTLEEIVLEIASSRISTGISTGMTGEASSSPALAEGMKMGGLTHEEMRSYRERAKTAALYVDFFKDVRPDYKRILVRSAEGIEIFDLLQTQSEFERFASELKDLSALMFPTSLDAFEEFLADWPAIKGVALRIQRGRSAAQRKVKRALSSQRGGDGHLDDLRERTVMEGLAEADGPFGEVVRGAGFVLDEEAARRVALQARRILDVRRLESTVLVPEMRRAVAAYMNVMPAEVNARTLWELLRSRGSARWYYEKLGDKGLLEAVQASGAAGSTTSSPSRGIDMDRARELARSRARQNALTKAERRSADVGGGFAGIGERMTWLVIMAMMVCVVGVANAMLMSVTERFREIATLKCLGALDGSIMLMFVMEAGLFGVVGGVAGAIAGSVIGLGRMLAVFGGVLFSALPTGQLVFAIVISTASGVILAGMAALYPSFRAARLAPMEAMRIQ